MALPVNATPIYSLTIPSSKEVVKFRPFLVKEEKSLLIAQQSEDAAVMIDTLKSVIKNCIKSAIDVESLATFDIEYIFTQLRARSVGEFVELIMSCDEDHGVQNKLAKVKVSIDLTKLSVTVPENHKNRIELFEDVGIVMKYPSIDVIDELSSIEGSEIDAVFKIIVDCIDYIYDSESVYYAKESSKQELTKFIDDLTSEQFKKLQNFFETMPKLKHDINYNCPVCGKAHSVSLEGMESFF